MKGKLLNEEEVKSLKEYQTVLIEYLDAGIFHLEYCKTVPLNILVDGVFFDKDENETKMVEMLDFIHNEEIKVYENVDEYGNVIISYKK